MKLKRFLPFFIILLIAGCAGFILIQSGSKPLDLEEDGIDVSGCSPCTAFMRDMNTQRQEDGYSQQKWKSLLSRIQSAGLEAEDEEPLIVSWAQLAYDDWSDAFTGWATGDSNKPENHQQKIKELKSMLASVNQLTAGRLKTLTQHAQAFKNFFWLTEIEYASSFESRRTALRKGGFSEERYSALEEKITEICSVFLSRSEVTRAKNALHNQRTCHWQMHNHYNMLVSTRKVKTELGHSDYSPSFPPFAEFRHGQDTFKPSEFTHYYNLGKSREWEKPVWN